MTLGILLSLAALAAGMKIHFAGQSASWQQLTSDRAEDVRPRISPDGRQIAFVSDRQGHPNIWVMGADGSGPRNLTVDRGENDGPVWSPDGRRIAFESTRGSGSGYIFIMNADGSGQQVVSPKPGTRPAWAPDGRSLIYNSRRDRKSVILKLDLETKAETVLTVSDTGCLDASWSPDGQWIVHTRGTPHGLQLFAMDGQGGRLRQLTQLYGRNARVAAWSPDGSRIAFNSEGDRENGIFVMRSDGTEVTRLTRDFGDATEPVWSHDGTRIYFNSQRSGNNDIYSIAVPRGTGERLTEDVGEDNTPAFCPVGNEVAFSSNRSGKFQYFSAGSIHRPGGEPDT